MGQQEIVIIPDLRAYLYKEKPAIPSPRLIVGFDGQSINMQVTEWDPAQKKVKVILFDSNWQEGRNFRIKLEDNPSQSI